MADAYHVIVASLDHELAGVGGSSVAVTSVGLGDSRTSTTLSIATAASEENRKVLLIDADERTRRLSELYGSMRSGPRAMARPCARHPASAVNANEYVRRLVYTGSAMVLPITHNGTDPDHPARSYHVPDVGQALSAVGQMFDLVLIDTPAVLAASDALSVAGQADGIVLLVPHRVLLRDLRDGPGASRLRQDAADRLHLRPAARPRRCSGSSGKQLKGRGGPTVENQRGQRA